MIKLDSTLAHNRPDAHGRRGRRAVISADDSHCALDAHGVPAVVGSLSVVNVGRPTPDTPTSFADVDYGIFGIYAKTFIDVQKTRLAIGNRREAMTRPFDKKGLNLPAGSKPVADLDALKKQLVAAERKAKRDLRPLLRQQPLWQWAESIRGVGEIGLAVLLYHVGDPYWNSLHDRPRTVSELWAYCGLHTVLPPGQSSVDALDRLARGDPSSGNTDHFRGADHDATVRVAAQRRKGQKANWSTAAKTAALMIVATSLRHHGPYSDIYNARRAHTEITHPEWTPAHRDYDARRITAKALLKDLWQAARDLHN